VKLADKVQDNAQNNAQPTLQQFCQDFLRFNDPTLSWGKSEKYIMMLTWARAISAFLVLLLALGGTGWVYRQLKQNGTQHFLEECQQSGRSPEVCGRAL
jgi:hypothetical protein